MTLQEAMTAARNCSTVTLASFLCLGLVGQILEWSLYYDEETKEFTGDFTVGWYYTGVTSRHTPEELRRVYIT